MLANMNPMAFMMGIMTMMMTDPSMVETAKLVMTKNSSNGASSPQQNGATSSQQQQQYSRDMALRAQRARVREIYEGPALPPDPQIGIIYHRCLDCNYICMLIVQVPTMDTQDDPIYSAINSVDHMTTGIHHIDQLMDINRHLKHWHLVHLCHPVGLLVSRFDEFNDQPVYRRRLSATIHHFHFVTLALIK
jgi:hypothetical protein